MAARTVIPTTARAAGSTSGGLQIDMMNDEISADIIGELRGIKAEIVPGLAWLEEMLG